MALASIFGLLIGAALGLRFRTFVIIPGTTVLATAIVVAEAATGVSILAALAAGCLGSLALQIGYLAASAWTVSRRPSNVPGPHRLPFLDPVA